MITVFKHEVTKFILLRILGENLHLLFVTERTNVNVNGRGGSPESSFSLFENETIKLLCVL